MHASQPLVFVALAAAANAAPAPPSPLAPPALKDLPKLPGLPKSSGLPTPPSPPTPPGGSENEDSDSESPTCSYDGEDDGTFDYSAISLREVGARNTLDWRLWLLHKCKPISFWHDVPLYPYENDTTIINAVVEIPRWTDGKIEIESSEPLTPIFHDDRNGAPRFVESVWPHKSYPFVYGSIPQTWENPNVNHSFVNAPGDDDPIDFFDIGQTDPGHIGQIRQSKVLGGIAPNDGGETDWKLLVIDTKDPIAALVNSVEDVEKFRPGLTAALHDWFRYYKVARGDGVIPITGGAYQNASYITQHVLPQGYAWWLDLISGKIDPDGLSVNQTSFGQFESFVEPGEAARELEIPERDAVEPAAEKPAQYDYWYYLDEDFGLIRQGEE